MSCQGALVLSTSTWDPPWRLDQVYPSIVDRSKPYVDWSFTSPKHNLQTGTYTLVMRVTNPLTNGKALRFANTTQDQDLAGWMTLGSFNVK